MIRREGKLYVVSQWALMWDDENYYMVGFDDEEKLIKHYRVDKMTDISITKKKRDGKEQFKNFNLPKYTKSMFGMFGGEETMVSIEGDNDMVGTVQNEFRFKIFTLRRVITNEL